MPDLAIVGGGLAGLAAAGAAADAGRTVRLLESGPQAGGAALLSNGSLWTFANRAEAREHCPDAADPVLGIVTEGFFPLVSWLTGAGVRMVPRGPSLYGASSSLQVDPQQLVEALVAHLAGRVEIQFGTTVESIAPHHQGFNVTTGDGATVSVRSLVLATGGTHTDQVVLAASGHGHYRGLAVRNRPVPGTGVRLGLAAGGHLDASRDGIYGHLVPAELPGGLTTSPLAAQYESYDGIVVLPSGEALTVPHTHDHDANRALTRAPGQRGVLYLDASAAPGLPRHRARDWAGERIGFAEAHGCRTATATDLDALVRATGGWGYAAPTAVATALLTRALRRPPFFALEVAPSITHSGVGLATEDDLAVVGVPGAFAAGQDIGRAFGDGYAGGLALALSSGRVAGAAASRYLDALEQRAAPTTKVTPTR